MTNLTRTNGIGKTPTDAQAAHLEWFGHMVVETADRLRFGMKLTRKQYLQIAREALRCADAMEGN